MDRKIILASSSPRRKELLKSLNISFKIHSPDVDETIYPFNDPIKLTQRLSLEKFKKTKELFPDDYVISADTVVCFQSSIFGKPSSKKEAYEILKILSNKTHKVITSVCMGLSPNIFTEITEVKFHELDDFTISWYLSTLEWKDKAGAYGIQGYGKVLIESIKGDYFNVVGLPISLVWKQLLKDEMLKNIL